MVPLTVIFPEAAEAEKLTVILFVLPPEVMFAPEGRFHEYPVAPEIAGTVYTTPDCPWQTTEVQVLRAPAGPGSEVTVTA